MEHYRRGALLQCCPAPTGAAAVSMSGEGRGRVPGDPGDGRDKLVLSQSNEERLCSHLIRILVDSYLHVWNPQRVKKKSDTNLIKNVLKIQKCYWKKKFAKLYSVTNLNLKMFYHVKTGNIFEEFILMKRFFAFNKR
ncbi:hypothetical protein FQA47_020574 [Oryzias melastigma]|uniref:Uncharacterized protein n=1 Tax=Oryzias melastigma TaxID=30732 RepID=A0A834FFW5_ORYME|nr:hypothetical protein FQA47_020574 [Oryzias melastigma]